MSLKDLSDKVNNSVDGSLDWQQIREEIISQHEQASTTEECVALLSLHKTLMDTIEHHLQDNVDLEKFREARLQEYNMLITRECLIGKSICLDTLYELTQRELEAGRMEPTHSFIDLTVDATATRHYSQEQLLRQEAKIQAIKKKSNLQEKLSRIFGK